jgi:undecaprenyl-diphosphatase
MNDWLVILILAVVQGIAEFLPVSSSGHVVIIADLLGRHLDVLDLNVVLHLGTLLSILVYYRRRILRLLGEDRRTVWILLLATLPAVVIGLPLEKWGSASVLENPLVAAAMLPITGVVLLWAHRCRSGMQVYQKMSWRSAVAIGLSQAAAILPGLSRSGLTISAGLARGLSPPSAAAFSFLLAIPAIGGAGLLKGISLLRGEGLTTPWEQLAVGMLVSFIVGLGSLWLLERMLVRGRFQIFAWWCIPAGLGYLLWRWLG